MQTIFPDTPLPPIPTGKYPYCGLTLQLDTKDHAAELIDLINRRTENALVTALGCAFPDAVGEWLANHAYVSWLDAEPDGIFTVGVVIGFLTHELADTFAALADLAFE